MQKPKKIKMAVTVDPKYFDALTELCRVTGSSRSAFVNEVLGSSYDEMIRLTEIVRTAKSGKPEDAKEDLESFKGDFKVRIEDELGG